jgi:TPP-dependent pyruvate/acetoin dehydrogenase alpha subunit
VEPSVAPDPPDPLNVFESRLIARGDATSSQLGEIRQQIAEDIAESVERAKAAAEAGDAELGMDDVYA